MHVSIVNIRVTAFARDLHWSLSGLGLGLGLGLGVALGLQVLMISRCRPGYRRGKFRKFGTAIRIESHAHTTASCMTVWLA